MLKMMDTALYQHKCKLADMEYWIMSGSGLTMEKVVAYEQ
jgi:hypothetical protein